MSAISKASLESHFNLMHAQAADLPRLMGFTDMRCPELTHAIDATGRPLCGADISQATHFKAGNFQPINCAACLAKAKELAQ